MNIFEKITDNKELVSYFSSLNENQINIQETNKFVYVSLTDAMNDELLEKTLLLLRKHSLKLDTWDDLPFTEYLQADFLNKIDGKEVIFKVSFDCTHIDNNIGLNEFLKKLNENKNIKDFSKYECFFERDFHTGKLKTSDDYNNYIIDVRYKNKYDIKALKNEVENINAYISVCDDGYKVSKMNDLLNDVVNDKLDKLNSSVINLKIDLSQKLKASKEPSNDLENKSSFRIK